MANITLNLIDRQARKKGTDKHSASKSNHTELFPRLYTVSVAWGHILHGKWRKFDSLGSPLGIGNGHADGRAQTLCGLYMKSTWSVLTEQVEGKLERQRYALERRAEQ